MYFKDAALKLASEFAFVHRYRYPNSCMIAREFSVAMLHSEILEGDLPACLSVQLDYVV
jgi:hypothetical protein